MVTVVVGCGAGLLVKAAIDSSRERSRKMREIFDREQALLEEFRSQNPAALDGWTVRPRGKAGGLTWSKEGIGYYDSNDDGRPDLKYNASPIGTTHVSWRDTNDDGSFDTEVQETSLGPSKLPLVSRTPLPKPIAVPSVPPSANPVSD